MFKLSSNHALVLHTYRYNENKITNFSKSRYCTFMEQVYIVYILYVILHNCLSRPTYVIAWNKSSPFCNSYAHTSCKLFWKTISLFRVYMCLCMCICLCAHTEKFLMGYEILKITPINFTFMVYWKRTANFQKAGAFAFDALPFHGCPQFLVFLQHFIIIFFFKKFRIWIHVINNSEIFQIGILDFEELEFESLSLQNLAAAGWSKYSQT